MKHYGLCVQQIVRDQCGLAAANSVCQILEALSRELRFSDNCDLDCKFFFSNKFE